MKRFFSARQHPRVVSGDLTEEQVLKRFIVNFEGPLGNKDGRITLDEFLGYYAKLSDSIEKDDYFALMITNAWKL